MARNRKLTTKYAGFPMFKVGTSGDTFPMTSPFTTEFTGLDGLALDLQFATDKTLTARKGPTPVFVRGSGATFVDSDGLVKYGPENLLLQSENFLSGWTTFGTSVQSVSSTNPFGGATSYKLTESAANAEHGIFRTSLITTGLATESIYAKEAGRRFCYLRSDATTLAVFDLIGGTVTQVSAGTTAFMTDAGNGWWRLSFTSQITGNYVLKLSNVGTGVLASTSYLGNGTSGVLIWGAQIERSSTARTYIPTTTAAVYGPRFDHDPITGVCKGLLMEESRTNIMPRSQDFTTGWTATNLQIVTSGFTSPSGDSTACSLVENNLTGIHSVQLASPSAVTAGSPYTGSIYAKENGATSFQLVFSTTGLGAGYANFVLSGNGSIGTFSGVTATIERLANGWYRCSMTVASAPGSGTNASILVVALNDNNSSAARIPSYLGDNATGVLVWGAQLELGSFPTSYIPTTTASVIRSADVCSITGSAFTSFFGSSPVEFTWNLSMNHLPTSALQADVRVITDTVSGPNRRWFYGDALANNTFQGKYFEVTNNINITPVSGYPYKVAISYTPTTNYWSVNGNTAGSGVTNGALLNSVVGAQFGQTGSYHFQYIRGFKKRLSNAKLQTLTV